jgi:hypothetical protein
MSSMPSTLIQGTNTRGTCGGIEHHRRRLRAAEPADWDAAEPVDATDRGAGIVHRRGDRSKRDIEDLDDAELHVLLSVGTCSSSEDSMPPAR